MTPTAEPQLSQEQPFDWFTSTTELENKRRFSLAGVMADDPRRYAQSSLDVENMSKHTAIAEPAALTNPQVQMTAHSQMSSETEEKNSHGRWQTALSIGKKALHFGSQTKEFISKTAEKIVNNRIVRTAAVLGTVAVLSTMAEYGISQAATGAENPSPDVYQKGGVGQAVSQQVATGGHRYLNPDFFPDSQNIARSMEHATHFLGLYAFVGSLIIARSLRFVRDSWRQHKAQQEQILNDKQHGTYSNFVLDYFVTEI